MFHFMSPEEAAAERAKANRRKKTAIARMNRDFERTLAACGGTVEGLVEWSPGGPGTRPLDEMEKIVGLQPVACLVQFGELSDGAGELLCIKSLYLSRSVVRPEKRLLSDKRKNGFELPPRRDDVYLSQFKLPPMSPSLTKLIKNYIADKADGRSSIIYKAVGIGRSHFHDVIKGYKTPGKNILIRLAFVLSLDFNQMTELLAVAGYALNPSSTEDMICQECFKRGICNLFDVNSLLEKNGCEALEIGDIDCLADKIHDFCKKPPKPGAH